jgi:hypothetical protein
MSDPKYDIYFRGEILPEADEAEVRAAIAKIFKADNAKLAQLFSGKVSTIKKSVDKATAVKYQQAFKKAGAKVVITIAKVAAESSVVAPEAIKLEAVKPQVIEGSWDVLPTGNDLLKPDERRNIPDVDIDTSAIKMVSPFAKVDVDEKIDLPAPDTSHFSIADVGEDMNPNRIASLPDLELDLSEFSVAEVGAPLADKKHKNVPPAPDIKHIKLV